MKRILRSVWLANYLDLRTKATGEETFEHVSTTCTHWCPINLHHNNSASIVILHVITYYKTHHKVKYDVYMSFKSAEFFACKI